MEQNRLMTMNIVSNILSAFFSAKTSFCIIHNKQPNAEEKERLLQEVLSMFENLSTTYFTDIEEIADSIDALKS